MDGWSFQEIEDGWLTFFSCLSDLLKSADRSKYSNVGEIEFRLRGLIDIYHFIGCHLANDVDQMTEE